MKQNFCILWKFFVIRNLSLVCHVPKNIFYQFFFCFLFISFHFIFINQNIIIIYSEKIFFFLCKYTKYTNFSLFVVNLCLLLGLLRFFFLLRKWQIDINNVNIEEIWNEMSFLFVKKEEKKTGIIQNYVNHVGVAQVMR